MPLFWNHNVNRNTANAHIKWVHGFIESFIWAPCTGGSRGIILNCRNNGPTWDLWMSRDISNDILMENVDIWFSPHESDVQL